MPALHVGQKSSILLSSTIFKLVSFVRDWESLVIRLLWEQKTVGSNPTSRTNDTRGRPTQLAMGSVLKTAEG